MYVCQQGGESWSHHLATWHCMSSVMVCWLCTLNRHLVACMFLRYSSALVVEPAERSRKHAKAHATTITRALYLLVDSMVLCLPDCAGVVVLLFQLLAVLVTCLHCPLC
eukprot:GHRR01021777.1.p1 GENE.GHRR01021777.1~~GHRR01021777.1.p1  ORF type:complete len:109 (+),score=22.70 GHRR01021777.1:1136-1462(+)